MDIVACFKYCVKADHSVKLNAWKLIHLFELDKGLIFLYLKS